MKTKKINAGIKSPAEAAQRMQDGEVFHTVNGGTFYYDETSSVKFILTNNVELSTPIASRWGSFAEWLVDVELPWYEAEDAFPRLCWVTEYKVDAIQLPEVALITKYIATGRCPFKTSEGMQWKLAKPLTSEEAAKYTR